MCWQVALAKTQEMDPSQKATTKPLFKRWLLIHMALIVNCPPMMIVMFSQQILL